MGGPSHSCFSFVHHTEYPYSLNNIFCYLFVCFTDFQNSAVLLVCEKYFERINMAQAMLDQRKRRKLCSDIKKKIPLLLATSYNLNDSGAKKIIVGLFYNKALERYQSVVQLISNHTSNGPILDNDSWKELVEKDIFQKAKKHLEFVGTPQIETLERLTIKKLHIILSMTYETRSVVFAKKVDDFNANIYFPSQNPSRKIKLASTSVELQKSDFNELETVRECIDAHLARLEHMIKDINVCKQLICEIIREIIGSEDVFKEKSREVFKNDIFDIKQKIKDLVISKLTEENQVFHEQYFNVLFNEIISLHHDFIYDEICYMFNRDNIQILLDEYADKLVSESLLFMWAIYIFILKLFVYYISKIYNNE